MKLYSMDVYHVVTGNICFVNYTISNMAHRGARTPFQAVRVQLFVLIIVIVTVKLAE